MMSALFQDGRSWLLLASTVACVILWGINGWVWVQQRQIRKSLARGEAGLAHTGREIERMQEQLDQDAIETATILAEALAAYNAMGARMLLALSQADHPMTLEQLAETLETAPCDLALPLARLYRGTAVTIAGQRISVTSRGRDVIDRVARAYDAMGWWGDEA